MLNREIACSLFQVFATRYRAPSYGVQSEPSTTGPRMREKSYLEIRSGIRDQRLVHVSCRCFNSVSMDSMQASSEQQGLLSYCHISVIKSHITVLEKRTTRSNLFEEVRERK